MKLTLRFLKIKFIIVKKMRRPGIEPGSPSWQPVLPILLCNIGVY